MPRLRILGGTGDFGGFGAHGARALAVLAPLALAGCVGGEAAGENHETCLAYGGPAGSTGYRDCLAVRAAQERDERLTDRVGRLSR